MRQAFRHIVARFRPIPLFVLAAVLSLCLVPAAWPETTAARRASARSQFERADRQRIALLAKPQKERTADEYLQLIASYRRVYLITPRAPEVQPAYMAVAELYHELGRRLDARYFQPALEAYQFLLHEYPHTRYRDDALLAIGKIQKDDLHETELAERTFQEFLKHHPRSPKSWEAQAALKQIVASRERTAKTSASAPPRSAAAQAAEDESKTRLPLVNQIRSWNAEYYSRVVIDLGGEVQYEGNRISDPDRIYFDLHDAKLSSTLAHTSFQAQNGFLKTIRVAQNQAGVVRVVLEVNKVKDYSVYLLPNPYRLVVDVYGSKVETAQAEPSPPPSVKPKSESSPAIQTARLTPPSKRERAAAEPTAKPNSTQLKARAEPPPHAQPGESAAPAPEQEQEAVKPTENPGEARERAEPATTTTVTREPAKSAPLPPLKITPQRSGKSAREIATALGPPAAPKPTHDGQQSLTRALGLKISRIVIDAGHGGQDTGTIGPTGLMEKDICLDVALRLGRIIQHRLPGAEVVYTRTEDTFIPLEERTAIANRGKADLFISIHANSSPDHKARGVETYYLNFSASAEAMEVASRENALAQGAVHDLQDLVRKIARNEKIEESRELATDIQDALSKRLQRVSRTTKNRGVRKAPFVVLIGANMPSVLAEVSFLSNPTDEQMLKKPDHRQRVAEGLYHGVESYLQSINSLTYNRPKSELNQRSAALAHGGNQR